MLRQAQLNIAQRRAGIKTPMEATPAHFATPGLTSFRATASMLRTPGGLQTPGPGDAINPSGCVPLSPLNFVYAPGLLTARNHNTCNIDTRLPQVGHYRMGRLLSTCICSWPSDRLCRAETWRMARLLAFQHLKGGHDLLCRQYMIQKGPNEAALAVCGAPRHPSCHAE